MLTLVNANRMQPLIAPIGLDYVAGAARAAGMEVEVLDLALADDPGAALRDHFAARIRTAGAAGLVFRRDARKVLALLDGLEDHDDVQKVHSNFDVSPGVLEKLQAG